MIFLSGKRDTRGCFLSYSFAENASRQSLHELELALFSTKKYHHFFNVLGLAQDDEDKEWQLLVRSQQRSIPGTIAAYLKTRGSIVLTTIRQVALPGKHCHHGHRPLFLAR
jgi:hypothetical protein